MNIAERKQQQCYFCGVACEDGDYCYGCEAYICDECSSIREAPWGKHIPEEHEILPEFRDEDEEM